jgi:cytochrome c biogenesis protein CcmG/thiol:disulfide interchange protein DsbE
VSLVALPCAVLTAAVLLLWPAPQTAPDRSPGAAPVVAQDRPAPDFSRPLVTGAGELGLPRLRGSVVVVNFWASWCAACREELPRLRSLARQQRGVVFLGVDEQDTRSGGRGFVRRFRPGYRSVLDADGSLLRRFGSIGVPSTFIVDRSGRIRYEALGAVDAAALRDAIVRLAP